MVKGNTTSIRLTPEGHAIREAIAQSLGISRTAAIELALRHYAQAQGIKYVVNPKPRARTRTRKAPAPAQ